MDASRTIKDRCGLAIPEQGEIKETLCQSEEMDTLGQLAGGVLEAAQELASQGETLRVEIDKFVNGEAA